MESQSETKTVKPGCRRSSLPALLAIVVLVALPIRLYLAVSATMISRDGAGFIWYAQGLADDPIGEMREQPQHPLYPALVLAAHGVVGLVSSDPVLSWQVAAVAVTLAGGLAVVVAMYALTAIVFDRRIGLIAAALAAVAAEFCQLSADALTDMPHLAVYLLAMAAAVRGMRDRAWGWLLAAGVLSGLAYLIRPEGAEVAVVAAALVPLARGWSWRQRLAGVLVLGLGAGLIASPYMIVTGKLVQKKSLKRFLGGDDESARAPDAGAAVARASDRIGAARAEARGSSGGASSRTTSMVRLAHEHTMMAGVTLAPADVADFGRALGRIGENWMRSLRVTLLLPAIVWLIRRREVRGEPSGHRLIASAVSLHLLILIALIVRFDYADLFSLRHVMVLAGLSLPYSAAGVATILIAVAGRWRRAVGVGLAVATIGPTLPWLFETRYADRAYLRQAGEWIRAQGACRPRILTTRHRVAFYAGGIPVRSPLEADTAAILAEARFRKPDWLVFDERRLLKASPSFFDDLERAAMPGERLERAHAVEQRRDGNRADRAIVYRYQAPP